MLDRQKVSIPVTDKNGNKTTEPLADKQSDGSMWSIPKTVGGEDHEHYFTMKPSERLAICSCGLVGEVYPYNSKLINGHIYDLKGNKKI